MSIYPRFLYIYLFIYSPIYISMYLQSFIYWLFIAIIIAISISLSILLLLLLSSFGVFLFMGSVNERRRYNVTSSLVGKARTQNEPCSPSHHAPHEANWFPQYWRFRLPQAMMRRGTTIITLAYRSDRNSSDFDHQTAICHKTLRWRHNERDGAGDMELK